MIDWNFYAHISDPVALAQLGDDDPTVRIHWTSSRKAAVVAAIGAGKIGLGEAKRHFRLSDEELDSWVAALAKNGTPGLRATRFQIYRDHPQGAPSLTAHGGDPVSGTRS